MYAIKLTKFMASCRSPPAPLAGLPRQLTHIRALCNLWPCAKWPTWGRAQKTKAANMVTFCGLNQSCICIYVSLSLSVSHSFDCICNSVDLHLLHNSNGFAAVAFRLIHFAHLTIEPRWTPPNANLDLVCLLQLCICICEMPETSVNKYFMRGYKYIRHFRALSQFAHLFLLSIAKGKRAYDLFG